MKRESTDPDAPGRRRARRRVAAALALLAALGVVAVGALVVTRATRRGPAERQSGAPAPIAPAQAATYERATAAQIDATLSAARIYVRKGEPAKSEAALLVLLDRAPQEQDVHAALAEARLALGKPVEALAAYERALAIGPVSPDLAFAAATAASMAGRHEDAEHWYLEAQRLDPGNPQRPLYLAQAQRKMGNLIEAKASLLRAAALDDRIAVVWGSLADIAMEEGALSVARGHIARARVIEPENTLWRLMEARIVRRNNDPETAARLLLGLDDAAILASGQLVEELALCYAMLGRTDDAASLYVRASAAKRSDAELAAGAAEWLDRAGRTDEAEVFASAAARLGSEKGRAILRRLRGETNDAEPAPAMKPVN